MPSISFTVWNTEFVGLVFTLDGVDNNMSDTEAQDLADRIKGSDLVTRYLGTTGVTYSGDITVNNYHQFTPTS